MERENINEYGKSVGERVPKTSVSYIYGRDRLTVIVNGEIHTMPANDPRVEEVLIIMHSDDTGYSQATVDALHQLLKPVNKFITLSGGAFILNEVTNRIYLEGSTIPVPKALSSVILEFMSKGYPIESLTNFWKNCLLNPSAESRESLYDFISHNGITITKLGYMVGYKGVKHASGDAVAYMGEPGYYKDIHGDFRRPDGTLASKHEVDNLVAGRMQAIKDAEAVKYVDVHSGTFNNTPGLVVTMERDKVDSDRSNGCSYGLHVGSYDYASTFGPVCLEVYVNPADVVSVPSDYTYQKIRVCKYFTAKVISEKYDGSYTDVDYAHIQKKDLEDIIPYLNIADKAE